MAEDDLVHIEDMSLVSTDIPDEVKIAIGEAIMAFSAFENTAEWLLWDLKRLTFEQGVALTGEWSSRKKFEALESEVKATVKAEGKTHPKAFFKSVYLLTKRRNEAAHGVWIIADGRLSVVSHRFRGPAGTVIAESYPLERLKAVARSALRLREILQRTWQAFLREPPEAFVPPHPPE